MRKIGWLFSLVAACLIGFQVACFAQSEPVPIEFYQSGGGQYIYCNNPEYITANDVSTKENPNSTYMMKNEKLGPDRYSVFFCFYNSAGFDLEPDMELVSDNAVIRINSVAYYIPKQTEHWICLGAWSDFMNMNIRSLDGTQQFVPYQPLKARFPHEFRLNGREWMSSYIYNYEAIKPNTTFNMLVDFTILEGEADVNFAALKHYGFAGDRSYHNPNAAPGSYHRDTSVKGIDTRTLPVVEADLDVTIEPGDQDGERVMAKVTNQYYKDGNVVPYWMTNINPSRDEYRFSKEIAAGSDMLSLTYQDDTKRTFYGIDVPQSQRDNIWTFDIYHHDTKEYEQGMPWKIEEHIPNAPNGPTFDIDNPPDLKWEFNLGNFGVTNRYRLKVTNTDTRKRYVNYMLDTVYASNIVVIRDENETMLNPYTLKPENAYALTKGTTEQKREDCMASIPVEPGETKFYFIDVILPTNCFGGMVNSLKIDRYSYLGSDPGVSFHNYTKYDKVNRVTFFNGKEYMGWEHGQLYRQTQSGWERVFLPADTERIFSGRTQDFTIVATASGYAARFCAWDEYPQGFIANMEKQNKVYFFDKAFSYLGAREFPTYIYDMTFADGTLYVQSDKTYFSKDNSTFTPLASTQYVPKAGRDAVLTVKNHEIYQIENGKTEKICYEGQKPGNIQMAGDVFYEIRSWKASDTDSAENRLAVSKDGIHWTDIILPNRYLQLLKVLHVDNKTQVVCRYETFEFEDEKTEPVLVRLDGELLGFLTPGEISNDRTMVPMRFFFEKLGAYVEWHAEQRQVSVWQGEKNIVFQIDSDTALVDGEEVTLDAPAYLKDDKTMIPLRFLSESLGYQVQWDAQKRLASIVSKIDKTQTPLAMFD